MWLTLLVIFNILSIAGGCHDAEREALLNFKFSVSDPSSRLSSWHGEKCCNWKGIECSSSGHVVVVDLRNPNPDEVRLSITRKLVSTSNATSTALNGTISPFLFTLKHIKHLDLSFNNFMYSKLPAEISNLSKLTYLNLSNAMFQDIITTQLANLTSLTSLDLSCARLVLDMSTISLRLTIPRILDSGSMFSFIGNGHLSSPNLRWLEGLRALRHLVFTGVDLSQASQSSKWAEPISVLSNLESLGLSNCNISGRIPTGQLLNLTSLSSLLMDFNVMSSPIPDLLSNLTSLSILDFTSNNLYGSIPYLRQLEELYVSSNPAMTTDLISMFSAPWPKLTSINIAFIRVGGPIPPSVSNSTSLTYFQADACSIQGSLPSSITNLTNLKALKLNDNNIAGQLPASISSLRSLQSLYLFLNEIEGYIPDSICQIPDLQYLNLASNQLRGNLPLCILKLPKLSSLYIQNNRLNGSISLSLFKKSKLREIGLGASGLSLEIDDQPFAQSFQPTILECASSNMTGEIPYFISNLTELAVLLLANNSLSGKIPSWLFNLPALSSLDLSMNNFEGVLPPMIQLNPSIFPNIISLARNNLLGPLPSQLKNVDAIDLSFNNFEGPIPAQLGVQNIRCISLAGNKLFGSVPDSFCQESNTLLVLDFSDNSFSGTMPRSLGNCNSLILLNLGQNKLSGSIPKELEGMKSLRFLDLNGNEFEGPFPTVIQNFQQMEVLNLAGNRFEGRIPQFIGELHSLRILMLASNSFNESIPEELMKLENLQYIGFSRNNLSGPIPEKLKGFKMLTTRQNGASILGYAVSLLFTGVPLEIVIKGQTQRLVSVFSYTSGIDLSHNALTGNIPEQISLLQDLPLLNLSQNHLSGVIPKRIGDMTALESLDLSYNHFCGDIPATLAHLHFLQFLNLSYNNLSGRIPNSPHFDTLSLDGTAYIGNKYLCGTPDGINCSSNSPPTTEIIHHRYEQESMFSVGAICLGYAIGISGLSLALHLMKDNWRNRYWSAVDRIVSKIVNFK